MSKVTVLDNPYANAVRDPLMDDVMRDADVQTLLSQAMKLEKDAYAKRVAEKKQEIMEQLRARIRKNGGEPCL